MHTLKARLTGFILSLLFTFGAFLIILHPQFLGVEMAIIFLFGLALLQFIVQCICFLNIFGEKWNFVVFVSTLAIIVIIILASLWIMNHLNENMVTFYKP